MQLVSCTQCIVGLGVFVFAPSQIPPLAGVFFGIRSMIALSNISYNHLLLRKYPYTLNIKRQKQMFLPSKQTLKYNTGLTIIGKNSSFGGMKERDPYRYLQSTGRCRSGRRSRQSPPPLPRLAALSRKEVTLGIRSLGPRQNRSDQLRLP